MKFKLLLRYVLVAALLLASIVFMNTASAIGKETVQRTIAIVYDNSGSMFGQKPDGSGNKSWCQAQYAIEVFATMMNKGDKLLVYPMWPVSVGDNAETYSFQEGKPFVVTEDSQKSLIHMLKSHLTPDSVTPIESIDAAHEGLIKEKGEKWLIVLTDGTEFYENGIPLGAGHPTKAALEKRLSDYSSDVNILYLGIGANIMAPEITPVKPNYYTSRTTLSQNVPVVLTELCNIIFGRDALPPNHITAGSVNFDIPLSKLYVFIQGENIGNVKLSGKDGEIKSVQTFSPTYGTEGCESTWEPHNLCGVDDTLQGHISIYEDLKSGEYTYSFSGNKSSIEFYYEVDADLQIALVNENGDPINNLPEVTPGEYTLRYALVDKDGNILESDLLGDVSFKLDYSLNGNEDTFKSDKSGEMKVYIGEDTEFALHSAEVNFLNGYTIRKSGDQLGFLSMKFGAAKKEAGDLVLTLTGGAESADRDRISDIPFYFAMLVYDGYPVEGDMLNDVNFSVEVSGEDLQCEAVQTEKGFEIKLVTTGGQLVVPAGEYYIDISAVLTSEKEKDAQASARISLKVKEISDILSVELINPPVVYSIIDLKNAPEIIVKISYNGANLTAEQFSQLNFQTTVDGLDLVQEPLPGKSSYSIKLNPDVKPEEGEYTIGFSASGIKDRLGNDMIGEEEHNVKVQMLPQWLVILLYFLLFLMLALLILLYMRMPVLPKKIMISNVAVRVNGEEMKSLKANVSYPTKGKKRDIKLSGTGILKNAYWKATVMPTKDSYRYLPSKKRKAMIMSGSVKSSSNVNSIMIGSEKFTRDENNKLNRLSRSEKDFNLSKGRISYTGSKDIDGITSDYSITGDIKFE